MNCGGQILFTTDIQNIDLNTQHVITVLLYENFGESPRTSVGSKTYACAIGRIGGAIAVAVVWQ